MITSGTYFVFPSESNLDIDSTGGLVKIVLPTAEAISTYISGSGGQVPEVIGYTVVGAATNPVRFYRGGGLLWNNGAEYLEITADGSGTISSSNGIQSISEAVLSSGGSTPVTPTYKVYTAKIDTVIISTTSGTLVIGKTYVLAGVAAGDNFANVGYLADNVAFVATATTPTVWSNGTEVTNITDSQPTVIVLQDTFPGISVALETQITNALYNLTFRKSNVFILTKFFPTTSGSNFSIKSDSLLTADPLSNGDYEFKVYN